MGPRPSYDDIARLAYQLWEERGRPDGSPQVDWERAEAALQIETTRLTQTPVERDEAMAEARLAEEDESTDSAVPPNARKRRTTRSSGQRNGRPQ
jgi:hypothetical protein